MGFFSSKSGSIISDYFKILEDIAQYKAENMIEISLYDKHLELSVPLSKFPPITLQYSQITDVYYGVETEIIEKSKSVIGRAAAGGLVFGPIGAIVGAVSGSGNKEKKELHFQFVISYKSKTGEDEFLKFEDTRRFKGQKVATKLKALCGIESSVVTSL